MENLIQKKEEEIANKYRDNFDYEICLQKLKNIIADKNLKQKTLEVIPRYGCNLVFDKEENILKYEYKVEGTPKWERKQKIDKYVNDLKINYDDVVKWIEEFYEHDFDRDLVIQIFWHEPEIEFCADVDDYICDWWWSEHYVAVEILEEYYRWIVLNVTMKLQNVPDNFVGVITYRGGDVKVNMYDDEGHCDAIPK